MHNVGCLCYDLGVYPLKIAGSRSRRCKNLLYGSSFIGHQQFCRISVISVLTYVDLTYKFGLHESIIKVTIFLDMDDPFLQRMRIYLHLVPVFGVVPSLWTLYSQGQQQEDYGDNCADLEDVGSARLKSASQLSVLIGLGCISAIALFGAAASAQPTQLATLRFLLGSSFVGSGYFLLSLALMFRVAKGKSIRIPGITSLGRRLP